MNFDQHNEEMQRLDREHGRKGLNLADGQLLLTLCKAMACLMIGVAAITYANTANARDLAFMPNQAGGEIVLTDSEIPACDGARFAYSRGEDGSIISGCWAAGENYIVIKWVTTGTIKLFRYAQFTPFEAEEPAKPAARTPDFRL